MDDLEGGGDNSK